MKLPVYHAGKSPRLIDHSGNGIGERGMLHPVENNGSNRHLTAVGFSPRLRRDNPGQQIHAPLLGGRGAARCDRHAQRLHRGAPHYAVGGKAVFSLKIFYSFHRLAAKNAVYFPIVIAPSLQLGLDLSLIHISSTRMSGGGILVPEDTEKAIEYFTNLRRIANESVDEEEAAMIRTLCEQMGTNIQWLNSIGATVGGVESMSPSFALTQKTQIASEPGSSGKSLS